MIDNGEVTQFPAELTPDPAAAHTLLDTQATGYFLPPGQVPHVARRRQQSRDGHDKKDTEGDYATAWLVATLRNEKGLIWTMQSVPPSVYRLFIASTSFAACAMARDEVIRIVDDYQAVATIVIADRPAPAAGYGKDGTVRNVAKVLQDYIGRVTGARLPLVAERDARPDSETAFRLRIPNGCTCNDAKLHYSIFAAVGKDGTKRAPCLTIERYKVE